MVRRGEESIPVVCTECPFERLVEREGCAPAAVIVEHGRETGHTLRINDSPESD